MRFFRCCAAVLGVLLSSVIVFAVGLMKNPYGDLWKFGRRTGAEYYLYSHSSQAEVVESVSWREYFYLTGEKSVFVFNSAAEAESQVLAWLKERRAHVIKEECGEWGQSIYLQAEGLSREAVLFGEKVNAQVVLSGAVVQIGFPLIFGGY